MTNKFQVDLQAKILEALNTKPMTATQIAVHIKRNYHSVRKALITLQDEGKAKHLWEGSVRDIKWTLGEDNRVNNSIPIVISKEKKLKQHLLMHSGTKLAQEALDNLPEHVTALFMYADRASNEINVERNLDALKHRMETDLLELENIADIYRQIIKNNRNWNPLTISRYLQDDQFNYDALRDRIKHFALEG